MAKEDRGFASMDRAKQREIASKGGKAAHQKGTAHEWTSEEAREAGRKGGMASHRRRKEILEGQTGTGEGTMGESTLMDERSGGDRGQPEHGVELGHDDVEAVLVGVLQRVRADHAACGWRIPPRSHDGRCPPCAHPHRTAVGGRQGAVHARQRERVAGTAASDLTCLTQYLPSHLTFRPRHSQKTGRS